MAAKQGGLKATITVAMSNYLEAGSIVAGAGGLTLWMEYLNLNDAKLGLLGALSANGFGSAIGAFLGGILVDKYGRKFIYKYDLLVYMLGILLIMFSFNFPMLLVGYVVTGIAVRSGNTSCLDLHSGRSAEGGESSASRLGAVCLVDRAGNYAVSISFIGSFRFAWQPDHLCTALRRGSYHLDYAAADQ